MNFDFKSTFNKTLNGLQRDFARTHHYAILGLNTAVLLTLSALYMHNYFIPATVLSSPDSFHLRMLLLAIPVFMTTTLYATSAVAIEVFRKIFRSEHSKLMEALRSTGITLYLLSRLLREPDARRITEAMVGRGFVHATHTPRYHPFLQDNTQTL